MIGTNDNMVMPVAPAMYGNGNCGGFGGDWGEWIILFLIFGMFGNGGWGNGFGGNNQLGYDFPWLLNSNNRTVDAVTTGFDNAAIAGQLGDIQGAITNGFANNATALCGGFAGVNSTVNSAQNAIAQQLYTNQISDLERSFAAQTASTQGFMGLQGQLAQCCCDNRLATCQTNNTIISEGNATRMADATNTRDIIDAQTRGTQAILDKLCALELDGVKAQVEAKNDEIARLRQDLSMKDLAASQQAQNAFIAQGFATEVDQLYNRLNNCPVPSTPVYGRTPIFTCNNGGCSCGSNGFVA